MADLSMKFAQIKSRLGRPLIISDDALMGIMTVLGPRLGIGNLSDGGRSVALQAPAMDASVKDSPIAPTAVLAVSNGGPMPHADDNYVRQISQPYRVVNGVAVICLHGIIVHRHDWLNSMCGMVSVESLEYAISQALEDDQVRGIYLDIDSPGGQAAGSFDAIQTLLELKEQSGKLIHVNISYWGYSGGYVWAMLGDHISCSGIGGVGSIGCLTMHMDHTKELSKRGVKATIIRRGSRKAENNAYEPITAAGLASLQAEVDLIHDVFVDLVVTRRPGLTKESVEATESACLTPTAALEGGFIDAIMSPAQAQAHFAETLD